MLLERFPDLETLVFPLQGNTMLELGNKVIAVGGEAVMVYKDYFTDKGMTHTSIDLNGLNGAWPLDLNQPLDLGTFGMVTNFGTSEHVTNQASVWANMVNALDVNSVLVSTTPKPGNWIGHGLYYPTREFYEALAVLNGLDIEELFDFQPAPQSSIGFRARRVELKEFTMPADDLMWTEKPTK